MHTRQTSYALICLLLGMLIIGCTTPPTVPPVSEEESETAQEGDEATHETGEMSHEAGREASTDTPPLPIELNPAGGQEIGSVYEAYLSPHQEPGEEKDTPSHIPEQFTATEPSLLRAERPSKGHALLRFTRDLSKLYIDVAVEDVNPEKVVMFHIHCGRPDMLGPIIVDFSLTGDIQENLEDGVFSVEITNEDIEATAASGEGLIGEFTMGCPLPVSLAFEPGSIDKVKTVAGMEFIARQGELYFNLHTAGQVYFGDMRGQIFPLDLP